VERKRAAGIASWLLAAAALGCATQVRVDFDPAEDFSSYRTWAWLPPGWEVPAKARRVDPELDALVRGAIERELASRGYAPAAQGGADFLVTYHLVLRRELVRGFDTPAMATLHSPHREGGFEVTASRPRYQPYEFGILVLDVADGRERQLVWRGIGTRRVRTSFKRRAEAVVAEIFRRFPPSPDPTLETSLPEREG
jgi:hypothetical protein